MAASQSVTADRTGDATSARLMIGLIAAENSHHGGYGRLRLDLGRTVAAVASRLYPCGRGALTPRPPTNGKHARGLGLQTDTLAAGSLGYFGDPEG